MASSVVSTCSVPAVSPTEISSYVLLSINPRFIVIPFQINYRLICRSLDIVFGQAADRRDCSHRRRRERPLKTSLSHIMNCAEPAQPGIASVSSLRGVRIQNATALESDFPVQRRQTLKNLWQYTLLASSVAITGWAGAQTTPATSLLALSKQDHTLAIIDPANLHVLAAVPVGDDPHEVIASADGNTAYVSNYGFGAFHSLAAIDLVNQKRLPSIELGALRGPHGLFFNQGKVWFTAEAAKAIGSYDPATAQIDWIMGTGQDRTHMLFVFPDSKRILTTNVSSATVTIFDKTEGRPGGPPPGMMPPGMPPAGAPPQGPPAAAR
jgi:hypothetical protein